MQHKVSTFCQQHNLFAPQDTVLVAVSGGADSVAALRVLHELRDSLGIKLVALHLNHGFRGAAAHADGLFVADLCQQLNIPIYLKEVDVPAILRSSGGSPQQVSRLQRLAFYEEVAAKLRAKSVVIGHHRDDQTETVLLHLIRGSGAAGLRGMAVRTPYGALELLRPLLCVSREEIEAYLQAINQNYCTDASNLKGDYSRNYLRHNVIPALRQINENVDVAVDRFRVLIGDDDDELCRQADLFWSEAGRVTNGSVELSLQPLCSLPRALSRRVVRRAWRETTGDFVDLELVHVEDILSLCARQTGRFLTLPEGIRVFKEPDKLCFRLERHVEPYEYKLPVPGEVILPGQAILRAEVVGCPFSTNFEGSGVWAKLASSVLTVRSRIPGDKYRPAGFSGRRKIKAMLREAGVPLYMRDMWPVVTDEGNIVWTPGARVADDYKAGDSGKNAVRLTFVTGGTDFAL